MYVQRNIDARSCNHWCRGKAICITYSECVFLSLVIQQVKRMRRLYNIFLHCFINGAIFEKTLLNLKHVFWFLCFVDHASRFSSCK